MGLTVKGQPMNKTQAEQARILLGVASQLNAGSIATEALICAAIGESTLTNLKQPNSSGYWGVLQGGSGYSGSAPNFPPPNGWNDSAGMAAAFLQGGKGFGNGAPPGLVGQGAIAFVRSGITDPGQIAEWCEDSGAPYSFYGQWAAEAKAIAAGYGGMTIKGRVAGGSSGGSGTVPDTATATTYPFSISGTDNPDEDYWTGICRLAQEVNWYLFSNGEYLYYMDGQEMLAQIPAAHIDRVQDAGRFIDNQGSLSYDNTAYEYVSTHKRRFRAQRRTKVSVAQSPTEANLELACGIDEILGGDCVVLSNFGLGDGRWIVAEARRSVFQTYTELTLVPAIAPITEAAAAGTTGSSLGTTGTSATKGTGAMIPTGGAAGPVNRALRAAQAVKGAPYNMGNHAGAINQSVAEIKKLGTDCSGYVSYILGPAGLGIWKFAYATPSIPTAPTIQAGAGQWITLYNNPSPGASGHVWIEIAGQYFECAGGVGVHKMDASEVQAYLQTGSYTPLHPAGY